MYNFLIFGGTSEGRELFDHCKRVGMKCTISVASDYGAELLSEGANQKIIEGRLDEIGMEKLIKEQGFNAVLDATHPYAKAVSQNIRAACSALDVLYMRIAREQGRGGLIFESYGEIVDFLKETEGNVLVTTGSLHISEFSPIAERVFARVLPSEESLRLCREAGIASSHIIAMQGPFSSLLNEALLKQYDCRYMVSKLSGKAGGFPEKSDACKRAGATLVCLGDGDMEELDGGGEIKGISLEMMKSILTEYAMNNK